MSAIMTGKKLLDMEEPLRAVDGLLRGIIELTNGRDPTEGVDIRQACCALAMRAHEACLELEGIWDGLIEAP
jgi:hypothetical protein